MSHVQGKIHTAMAIIAEKAEIRIGDRVHVKEVMPGRGCKGVVRFIGSVDFVDDMTPWYGVELDSELGRHDGTVQGVRFEDDFYVFWGKFTFRVRKQSS